MKNPQSVRIYKPKASTTQSIQPIQRFQPTN